MIDIVDSNEQIPTHSIQNDPKKSAKGVPNDDNKPNKPSFHNPNDIPQFDAIESIEVIEVGVHHNCSVNSIDELVPELEGISDHESHSLNRIVPTIQQ